MSKDHIIRVRLTESEYEEFRRTGNVSKAVRDLLRDRHRVRDLDNLVALYGLKGDEVIGDIVDGLMNGEIWFEKGRLVAAESKGENG